ncbi:zinc finger protein 318 isoform X2 [Xyrauchen texanus]|uniref:zinc finger protein 318 isoform X2 n=1 Tax=Xyrauchen texanus TaxID=154827 RepID=UPI002241CA95|nr:zinc finger protein 318 isoform X2 [Xyrauchen texanus]
MYRGSRPHRGDYEHHHPPSRGFDPRSGPGHPPDPYRRPSPRRRYSSPGARDPPEEYRGGGRPSRPYRRYSPSPPRGGLPVDHSLVITVGNELTNPPGYKGSDAPYVRDYGAGDPPYKKPHYSPRRSSYDDKSDRGSRRRSLSRGRSRGRSRSPGYVRSKSRPRSRSRSRSYSHGRSPERAKSRARSKSQTRGRSYSRSRSRSSSPKRSRARSKSRHRSCSRDRSRSRGRSHARSRSVSQSGSSSHSSNSSRHGSVNRRAQSGAEVEDFRELEKARRRKEIQDTLGKPAKSILKKRVDSSETDSPMLVQNSDSPRGNPDSILSHEAEQLICALSKSLDPDLLASMLGKSSDASALEQLIGKIHPAKDGGSDMPDEKERQDKSDLTEFLGMMAEVVAQPPTTKKGLADIEDEEKFLYGDEEEDVEEHKKVKPAREIPTAEQPGFLDTRYQQSHDIPRKEHATTPYAFGHDGEDAVSHLQRESRQPDRHHSSATPEVHSKEELDDLPPGVFPQDVKERKEVEEYEKIQDLLKTIGLDLGVADISKMAARTQERLHGNTPAKKAPIRRQSERKHRSCSRSYSNSSSSSRSSSRSHSRSSSRSQSRSYGRTSSRCKKKPVSPEQRSSSSHSQNKKESRHSVTEGEWPSTPTAGPGTQMYPPQPSLSTHPMAQYPQPPPRRVMPPDYPPGGYDPYGNYVPYMPPGWPMYPPPGMPLPPHNPMDPYRLPNMERTFLKVIETAASEGKEMDKIKPSKLDDVASKAITSSIQRRVIEDKNTASQKQKVTEELAKLKMEKEIRLKRKENLLKEVETLRREQGELLRKKRREKDGHKDPVLTELSHLQEDAMARISKLRAEQKEADKKHEELVKVSLILGIDKYSKISGDHGQQPAQSKESSTRSPEKTGASTGTSLNKVAPSKSKACPEKRKSSPPSSSRSLDTAAEQFEYYDAGNHWCKNCNVTSGSMFDYFMHLHNKIHRKTLDPYDRPWAKSESEKKHPVGERTSKPAKGSEFLIPLRGFFCQLCEEFFGDPICAEAHVTCHAHNEKYKAKIYENPLYEQRRNLDRQAGLESQKSSDHKRKREDDCHDDVKKSKPGKEERKMLFDNVEPKPQYSKEDTYRNIKENENTFMEERFKYRKEDLDKQKYKEDERVKIKKEEEEKEKARYRREEEERYMYKKEEECTYRYRKEENNKYRFRKDDDRGRYVREEEKPKYSKEEDKRYKYTQDAEEKKSKYKDEDGGSSTKSKWNEAEESNEQCGMKDQKGKSGFFKDDKVSKRKPNDKDIKVDPEKPSESPKVFSGPSPALLAKLRKKNEEAAARPGFGKFSRKKPLKTALEKEADRIAAQFIKEDEASVSVVDEENKDPEQDAFTKSIAAAKSIVIKLSAKSVLPPSDEWLAYNENKSSPNFPPTPTPMVLRKSFTGVQNKPTTTRDKPPGTVPGNQTQKGPALPADLISKAFSGEEVQLKLKKDIPASPVDTFDTAVPLVSTPAPLVSTPAPLVSTPSPLVSTPASLVSTPAPIAVAERVNAPQVKLITQSKCFVTVKSDVAAPGVPEEEQKLSVIFRPPPLLLTNSTGPSPKTVKPKTTLAAGIAKDLFDIFYSGNSAVKSSGASVGNKQDSIFTAPDKDSSSKKTSEGNESNNKDINDSDVTQSEEPPKSKDLQVAWRDEPLKDEDSQVAQSKEPHKNEDSQGSQSKEPPKDEDSQGSQCKEPHKNEDSQGSQSKEPPKDEDAQVAWSEEPTKNEASEVKQASEDENLKENIDSKEEKVDEHQVLTSEISEGGETMMEVDSLHTIQPNHNEEETPLESEEPMPFSPLPGNASECVD